MSLVAMREVSFGFGGPMLLEGINFQLEAGERVCLLGRNGSGKSTFLRLLKGELEAKSGEISRQSQIRIGMLEQSVPAGVGGTVFDVVAQGLGQAGKLLAKYHKVAHDGQEGSDVGEQLIRLGNELERAGAWKKLNVVETAISQVSVDAEAGFAELSAGLKRRVLLARALAAEPDLLLLDEPTNHLDIESISWIEEFLSRCGRTLLFVTHDRRFLKKLSTRIVEIDRGRLFSFDCRYEDYLKRKANLISAEQKQWGKFDKKLAEEEVWIRKGIQARRTRNEGRVGALKKMRLERSKRREMDGLVRIEVNRAERSGNLVATTEGVGFSYGDDEKIIDDLNTVIIRGDRIGVIGANGIGKTTLLRLLLGEIKPSGGTIELGTNVQCAYFDQLHGQLDLNKSVVDNIGLGCDTVAINGRKKNVVAYLMDFMFTAEKAKRLVSNLSGGERNRLQIAKVFTQPSNVLVLDEPTNDLDIETLELLEEMLLEYPGTVMVVSHDRAFLNNVVTSTLVLEGDGKVAEYAGGYDDWLIQRKEPKVKKEEKVAEKEKTKKPRKARPAKLSYMQKREYGQLPELIERLEGQITELHEKMAEPEFYKQDGQIIAETKAMLDQLDIQLSNAYGRWEELVNLE